MSNLINMSDNEKIIFVTGINESDTNINISELAREYPFAVFFTSDNAASAEAGYPVANLWKGMPNANNIIQGIRLNRFIGIDKNNDTIRIGDHTVKLSFDYQTGLLSILDANKLDNIKIKRLRYYDLNNNLYDEPINSTGVYTINSINNIFYLDIEYNTPDDGTDPTQISKLLSYNGQDFQTLEIEENGSSATSITYRHAFQILTDTYQSSNIGKEYTFTSTYSSDKKDSIKLNLILNPIEANVYVNGSEWIEYINVIPGDTVNAIFRLKPSTVTSYTNRPLYVETNFSSEYITVDNLNVNVLDGTATVTIHINEDIINSQPVIELNFNVKNDANQNYNVLSNTVRKIRILGNHVESFFFAGYLTSPPTTQLELTQFNSDNIGSDVLYDATGDTSIIGQNSRFYVLIPKSYEGIIMPRWDAFTYSSQEVYAPKYVSCLEWFDVLDDITINQVEFKVYKYKYTGKFYGKIQ